MSQTFASTAVVPTANGGRYLQQLCKHWQHNLAVDFDAERGRVVFPRDSRGADWPADAVVIFQTRPDALEIRIDASAPGQLGGLKGAVERHLDRFAFRETPLAYAWS